MRERRCVRLRWKREDHPVPRPVPRPVPLQRRPVATPKTESVHLDRCVVRVDAAIRPRAHIRRRGARASTDRSTSASGWGRNALSHNMRERLSIRKKVGLIYEGSWQFGCLLGRHKGARGEENILKERNKKETLKRRDDTNSSICS